MHWRPKILIKIPGPHYLHLLLLLCYRNSMTILLSGSVKWFHSLEWNFVHCSPDNRTVELPVWPQSFLQIPGMLSSQWMSWIAHGSKRKDIPVLQLVQSIHIKPAHQAQAALFCSEWTPSKFPGREQQGNWTCPKEAIDPHAEGRFNGGSGITLLHANAGAFSPGYSCWLSNLSHRADT